MTDKEVNLGDRESKQTNVSSFPAPRPPFESNVQGRRHLLINHPPMAVAGLIAAILTLHVVLQLAGTSAAGAALRQFGVIPVNVLDNFAQRQFGAALLPLVSHQFFHAGLLHLIMNLAMFLQAGPIAELGLHRNRDGALRFCLFFFACGIGGALFYCWLNPSAAFPTIGASGAISGVFAGFLWAALGLVKPGRPMLRPLLASGAVFLLINVGLAWVGRALNVAPIAWESHLGGFMTGLILYPLASRAGRSRPA